MSNLHWQRLEALFDTGSALPADERAEWLAGLELDPELHQQLQRMLDADLDGAHLTQRLSEALGAAIDAPVVGTRLGPWRLLDPLGSGGMGQVFLAERVEGDFHQQVAIKLIHRLGSVDAANQLRHERQVLAGLDHPGIARLFDGGETPGGQPYLVMEHIRGAPITTAAKAQNLPLRRRLELLRDLALAVHYAHQRLLIHRDIKPGNVLLREDGRAVLLDFGIAKLIDNSTPRGATQPWFTPAYASPEQRRGEPVSTATDVYALGLLAFELLTDQEPQPDAEGAITAPSRVADPPRTRALRGDLDTLVLRAAAVEPGRRYPSAQALAQDIERWLLGRPLLAAPDRFGYRLNKLLRRHPLAAASSALLVMASLAFGWRLADERDRALRAESSAEREAANARSVTGFLVNLFAEADPEHRRSAAVSPQELLDRGLEQLQADNDMAPLQRATLLATLGALYNNLGEPEKATAVLDQALALDAPAAAQQRAEWLQQRGQAHELRQRFADAEVDDRAAVALLRGHNMPLALSDALASHGLILSRLDRNDEAEVALREAISLRREHEGIDSVDARRFEVYLGEALYNAGHDAAARSVMDAAIKGLRDSLPADDADLIAALGFYGVLLRDMGDAAAAEQVFLEILAHRERLLDGDSEKIALVHNNLGRVYYNTGRTREAITQFQAAYSLGDRPGAQQDPSRAIDMLNLGSLYEQVGDYPNALPLMRQAVAILEADPANARALLPMAHQNLGRLLMLAGDAAESRRWLALPIGETADRDWALERSRQRLHLGEWERRHGNTAEAERWLREVENHLDEIGGTGSPRLAQLERTRGLLALAANDFDSAKHDLDAARERLVKARGERFVGAGEIDLDLAELELARGATDQARTRLASARGILDPVLIDDAPQRTRLAALQRRAEN